MGMIELGNGRRMLNPAHAPDPPPLWPWLLIFAFVILMGPQ